MPETVTRRRTLTEQVHWRVTPDVTRLLKLVLDATQERQSDLLRRLIVEEARRLSLAPEPPKPSAPTTS